MDLFDLIGQRDKIIPSRQVDQHVVLYAGDKKRCSGIQEAADIIKCRYCLVTFQMNEKVLCIDDVRGFKAFTELWAQGIGHIKMDRPPEVRLNNIEVTFPIKGGIHELGGYELSVKYFFLRIAGAPGLVND